MKRSLLFFLLFASVAVIFGSLLHCAERFEKADTDGDGVLECWDVLNSTYADSDNAARPANRMIRTFLAGTTRVVLIDVYRRSAVPAPTDFDGFPDAVWLPEIGIVEGPFTADLDGDGASDLGIDLDGDGAADGAFQSGSWRPFGQLRIRLRDNLGRSRPGVEVRLSLPGHQSLQYTDAAGKADFALKPTYGQEARLHLAGNEERRFALDLWAENEAEIALAAPPHPAGAFHAEIYPNPVAENGEAHLLLGADSERLIEIELFDFHHRFLSRLLEARLPAGEHRFSFAPVDAGGTPLSPGLYYILLRWGGEKQILKLVVR